MIGRGLALARADPARRGGIREHRLEPAVPVQLRLAQHGHLVRVQREKERVVEQLLVVRVPHGSEGGVFGRP